MSDYDAQPDRQMPPEPELSAAQQEADHVLNLVLGRGAVAAHRRDRRTTVVAATACVAAAGNWHGVPF